MMYKYESPNDGYIDKINATLAAKKGAIVNIINDKLTLSVFAMLERNLKNVKEINIIIRDPSSVPKGKVLEHEFLIESEPSPMENNI